MTRYTRSTLPGAMRVYRALVSRGLDPAKPRWIGGPEPFAVDLPDTGPSEPATAPDAPPAPSPRHSLARPLGGEVRAPDISDLVTVTVEIAEEPDMDETLRGLCPEVYPLAGNVAAHLGRFDDRWIVLAFVDGEWIGEAVTIPDDHAQKVRAHLERGAACFAFVNGAFSLVLGLDSQPEAE